MIARIWRGRTHEADAETYLEYLHATGLKEYRAVEGNLGVRVLRRIEEGRAEFVLISLWESYEAIRQFAGDDIETAVYYPEDRKYLLELEPQVIHYDVVADL